MCNFLVFLPDVCIVLQILVTDEYVITSIMVAYIQDKMKMVLIIEGIHQNVKDSPLYSQQYKSYTIFRWILNSFQENETH